MYRGTEYSSSDFSGGMITTTPITELNLNQASTLDNIVVFSQKKGFRTRYGDSALTANTINGSIAIQGLGYLRLTNSNEYLVAVSGTKVFATAASITDSFSDITDSVSITSGNDNIWSFFIFNNKLIGFGGPILNPDPPMIWTGSGNMATLGGTPPNAYNGFQANDVVFAYRTAADPSTIFWTIIGNEADWSGVGSGSADVWTSDGDVLTSHAVLNTNTVLLFKENSIHQMQIGSLIDTAYPIYSLFSGVGCAGKNALVIADGLVYFITPQGRMKITDGTRIYDEKDLPSLHNIDDQLSNINVNRLKYIQGIRKTGLDYDHIIWSVSLGGSQTTNNQVFIWDLTNKCWLQNTTGYKVNSFAKTQSGIVYAGEYNGKVYIKDNSSATYSDASNSSSPVIGSWTSGWIHNTKFETIKQPRKFTLSFATQQGGQVRISYGFDFKGLTGQQSLNQTIQASSLFDSAIFDLATFADVSNNAPQMRLVGRGNFFQFQIQSPVDAFPMKVNGFSVSGKEYGQKITSVR